MQHKIGARYLILGALIPEQEIKRFAPTRSLTRPNNIIICRFVALNCGCKYVRYKTNKIAECSAERDDESRARPINDDEAMRNKK